MPYFTTSVVAWVRAEGLPHVNVLPQQRSELANLQELADSIEGQGGLINPINILVLHSLKEAIAYENFFRKLYGNKKRTFVKESSLGSGVFYLLVAGHRRYASIALTKEGLVPNLSVAFLLPPAGANIKDIALEAALFQAAENIHERPNPIDEASSLAAMRRAISISRGGGRVPINEIARRAGRSADTVANAIKFFEMPNFLQAPATAKKISYGKVLLLGRLYKESHKGKRLIPEDIVKMLLKTTIANNTSEAALKRIIDEYISHAIDVANGYDIFSSQQITAGDVLRSGARNASEHQSYILRAYLSHLQTYLGIVKGDQVLSSSPMASIYRDRDVAAVIMALSGVMEDVAHVLHRRDALNSLQVARVRRSTRKVRRAIVAAE